MKSRTYSKTFLWLSGLFSVTLFLAQCTNSAEQKAIAETETTTQEAPVHKASDPIERGAELYLSYCRMCHGTDGEQGPMADLLKGTPPDLTKIAARRNGTYPEALVFDIIKGKKALEAHGGEMPVESALGKGTKFCIRLPCEPTKNAS